MKVLIGSTALQKYIDLKRTPTDVDYFSDSPIDGAECFYHKDLEKWDWGSVATLDELYTIKVSHIFWSHDYTKWNKHAGDIMLMKQNGAEFIRELYDILYPIWVEHYGAKKANLNKQPDEFFASTITRIYEHDSIHAAVAYGDTPLFNKILRDDSPVAVSEEKFNALDYDIQLQLVREELYATACERMIIPASGMTVPEARKHNLVKHPVQAYRIMLHKMVTSLSKGWFPLFIVLHLDDLRSPDVDYVQRLSDNADRLVPVN